MAIRRLIQIVGTTLVMAGCFFAAAGRLNWRPAWILLAAQIGGLAAGSILLSRRNPDLIAERTRIHRDAKSWDKVLGTFVGVLGPLATWIVAGLDVRLTGTVHHGTAAQAGGLAVWMAGMALVLWSMVSNPFFSTVVRIQSDRGHKVASGGPYRFARHPGYVGMIACALATPILLASQWALAPGAVMALLLVVRTAMEDATLRKELAGYPEYAARVRFRLLPLVW